MSRPAESPGGLANTEPAFEPPGWCSRRHRTIAATSASAVGGVAVGHPERGPGDHLGAA